MKTRTVLFSGALILLALFLLLHKRGSRTETSAPEKVTGLPTVEYVVPPLLIDAPENDGRVAFNWIGQQCGCNIGPTQGTEVIDTILLGGRPPSGAVYVAPPAAIPPALKGAPSLVRNPPMPDPIIYEAARPSFWWGWRGLTRVIYTSDGATLATGLSNRQWSVVAGTGILDAITIIRYNGQEYALDSARSQGL